MKKIKLCKEFGRPINKCTCYIHAKWLHKKMEKSLKKSGAWEKAIKCAKAMNKLFKVNKNGSITLKTPSKR